MAIWIDPNKCKGCLRCETACSFHNSGHTSFQPSISSTKVLRSNENKKISISIDSTCDMCRGESFPLCVKACVFGARGVIS
jgi:carbon-monoxide dehydrogenase iron sulfur subunit